MTNKPEIVLEKILSAEQTEEIIDKVRKIDGLEWTFCVSIKYGDPKRNAIYDAVRTIIAQKLNVKPAEIDYLGVSVERALKELHEIQDISGIHLNLKERSGKEIVQLEFESAFAVPNKFPDSYAQKFEIKPYSLRLLRTDASKNGKIEYQMKVSNPLAWLDVVNAGEPTITLLINYQKEILKLV